MSDIAKLSRGIAAGEKFEYDGSIEVDSVGQGATVTIKNGGLRVKGNVDDGANITVRGQTLSNNFTISSNGGGNSITGITAPGEIEHHIAAAPRQRPRGGSAHARRAAGDQRHPACQIRHNAIPRHTPIGCFNRNQIP